MLKLAAMYCPSSRIDAVIVTTLAFRVPTGLEAPPRLPVTTSQT